MYDCCDGYMCVCFLGRNRCRMVEVLARKEMREKQERVCEVYMDWKFFCWDESLTKVLVETLVESEN